MGIYVASVGTPALAAAACIISLLVFDFKFMKLKTGLIIGALLVLIYIALIIISLIIDA